MIDKVKYSLILLIVILLIIIIFRKQILFTYENFVCSIDTGVNTHLMAYYRRCINDYKIEERGGSVPLPDTKNNARALINFYLNQNDTITNHNNLTKFGLNPGWVNQINKSSICPEYAYYLYRHFRAYRKSITMNNELRNLLNNTINQYNSDNSDDFTYYMSSIPSSRYLSDESGIKFKKNDNNRELLLHQKLLSYFLSKIQNSEVSISPGTRDGIGLVWGLPYLIQKNDSGIIESITGVPNISNFNNYFQLKFNIDSEVSDVDESLENVQYLYLVYNNNDELVLTPNKDDVNDTNSLFEVISAEDCNQYLRIKKKDSDKFLKYDSNDGRVSLGGSGDIDNKLIVSIDDSNTLALPIDEIFVPPSNYNTNEGKPVSILFTAGKIYNHFISYLGITKINGTYHPKAILGKYNNIEKIGSTVNIPDIYDVNDKYSKYIKGISFIRGRMIEEDSYAYQENKVAKPVGTEGRGIIQDNGLIKVHKKNDTAQGFLNAGENIKTNQKIFPIVSNNEVFNNDSNSLENTCVYTGTQTNENNIAQVCNDKDGRCYGMYDSPDNNYKMAYVGEKCNRDLKYFDKFSNNISNRIDRGKVNCQGSGELKEIKDDKGNNIGKFYKCYLPKYHTKEQDNSLISLLPAKRFNDPSYCQANLDYGKLDGPDYAMYLNNANCVGEYEMEGAPLKGGRCELNEPCTFSKYDKEDEYFLMNQDFSNVMNKQVQLKKQLKDIHNKIKAYKTDLRKKMKLIM